VVKTDNDKYESFVATTFIHKEEKIATSSHQIAVQFLYREKDPVSATEEIKTKERFLVLIHKESKLTTSSPPQLKISIILLMEAESKVQRKIL
jgi:hypothetical protein